MRRKQKRRENQRKALISHTRTNPILQLSFSSLLFIRCCCSCSFFFVHTFSIYRTQLSAVYLLVQCMLHIASISFIHPSIPLVCITFFSFRCFAVTATVTVTVTVLPWLMLFFIYFIYLDLLYNNIIWVFPWQTFSSTSAHAHAHAHKAYTITSIHQHANR